MGDRRGHRRTLPMGETRTAPAVQDRRGENHCVATRAPQPLTPASLGEVHGGPGGLEGLLGLLGFVLGDAFEHRLRRVVDELLGLLETQ